MVATADHYHYGIAYGSGQYSMDPTLEAMQILSKDVEHAFRLLESGDYASYLISCLSITKSDWVAGGILLNYLNPICGSIVSTTFSEFGTPEPYGAEPPSWVLCALTKWERTAV